ncbi:ATP-dependent DNA helicase Rep [subsurface metagenome]
MVSEVERLAEQTGVRLGGCAVMYRTNAQSRALEEAFIRYGTSYKLVAGTRFYERREVKDIIAYLRLIQNPDDSVSLLRVINVPQRGIGQRSLSGLSSWAGLKGLSLYQALRLVAESGEDKPPLNPRALGALASFGDIMAQFISRSKELDLTSLFDLVIAKSGYKDYLLKGQDGCPTSGPLITRPRWRRRGGFSMSASPGPRRGCIWCGPSAAA